MMPGMRGMDSRRMNMMMKKLGIKVEELEGVEEVVIVLRDRKLVFKQPDVTVMDTQGQRMYQVVGEPVEAAKDSGAGATGGGGKSGPVIPKEDIQMVAQQAGVSEEKARKALEETDGDIAEAIIRLMGG